jgi:hypothetical protein
MSQFHYVFRCILALCVLAGVRAGIDAAFGTKTTPTPNVEHSFYDYSSPASGNRPLSLRYPFTTPNAPASVLLEPELSKPSPQGAFQHDEAPANGNRLRSIN